MTPEDLLSQKPIDYSTMYIDMDSFFASVEQYYNPSLRHQPVAVVTGKSMGASVIAASYIAKEHGIHTGIKVREAIRLCPSLQITCGNPSLYRRVHNQIMSILHDTICQIKAKGIDEAYLKVPTYARSRSQVFALSKAIKASIYNLYNEHINCSIGIASNIWLAKMAASHKKPNGLVCITGIDLPKFYKELRLTDLTGIGHRMERQFYDSGIITPSDLYSATWRLLSDRFGVNGQKWYLRLRGYEVDQLLDIERKSLGHQVTITDINSYSLAKITTYCIKISEVLGYRLRNNGLYARGINMDLVFVNGLRFNYNLKKLPLFNTNNIIIGYSKALLKKLDNFTEIKRISITLTELTSVYQLSLLPEPLVDSSISKALDDLENRYHSKVVLSAKSLFEKSFALDRIGFATDEIRKSSKHQNYSNIG
ncbi:MAG: UmuC protein [Patescibacteria group bacterium]|jgi:DNA polymerase-4|nr:UmuC protein [Patescibacteria group bacterium]